MTTTPEPSKGVPRLEGDPALTPRADHNALADWVRDHAGEVVATVAALPSTGNWPFRLIWVLAVSQVWVWNGTAWKPFLPKTGTFSGPTNSDGIATVTHGLGAMPANVQVFMRGDGVTDAVARLMDVRLWEVTSTLFRVRNLRLDTNAWHQDTIRFDWVVYP